MGVIRAVWHWFSWVCCLPLTILGFTIYLLGFAYPFRVDGDGVFHFRALPIGIHSLIFGNRLAGAYTMGCCICWPKWTIAPTMFQLNHEKRHAAQMRTWMAAAVGLFLLTYGAFAGWSLIRTGNIWQANPLELDAIHHERLDAGPH